MRDWRYAHLSNCVWYLDYPKENILTLEFEILEKHELGFLKGLGALEKEKSSKKILEASKRRGNRQIQESGPKM